MSVFEKIKKTCRYYKSLGKKAEKLQQMSDLKIRSDVYAFLTCPEPILPSEKK
ncbi:MAG: hypothetical protein MJ080_05185 [Clostridia bacterium]|nr:hypothetical protein [Clostridia bacterium]